MHDIQVLSPLASAARHLFADTPLYDPVDLAVFQSAYDEACRVLGLDPAPRDAADGFAQVRDRVASAVLEQARSGERDCAVLASFAVARGLRFWPLT
jgi:hypothetical protein